MKTVSLVGSTGSIGTQAIEVINADRDRYRVVALAAATSVDVLATQARQLRPDYVAIADAELGPRLKELAPAGVEVLAGPGALEAVAAVGDVVVNGVVGFAGLGVTVETLRAGRRLALANKESLIAGGPVVQAVRATPGAEFTAPDTRDARTGSAVGAAPSGAAPGLAAARRAALSSAPLSERRLNGSSAFSCAVIRSTARRLLAKMMVEWWSRTNSPSWLTRRAGCAFFAGANSASTPR